jgi:TolA-binding protein
VIPDRDKALKLIEMYREYCDTYSSDTTGSEYLYKAADLANGLNESALAIKLYQNFHNKYPGHEKAPVAFFLQGFIYENQLSNLGEAKTVYEEFLKKYPDHPLAKDVQFSIDNLGKSPEELIRQFEQKQQADTMAKK